MTYKDIVPGGDLKQGYGMTEYARSGAYGGGIHTGIDIGARRGSPAYIPTSYKSRYNGWEPRGYGNFTVITTNDGYELWYGHFGQNRGEGFESGNVAGYVGSSGNSTGPHVHFEVRKNGKTVDPVAYLANINKPNQGASMTEQINARRAVIYNAMGGWWDDHDDEDIKKNHLGTSVEQLNNDVWTKGDWKAEYFSKARKIYTEVYGDPPPGKDIEAHYAARKPMAKLFREIAFDQIRSLRKG